MTDIETIPEKRHIYSEPGETSPLSDLPTSPGIYKQMTTDQTPTSTNNNTTTANEPTSKATSTKPTEGRSKSIVSDESSDLSDLDSEAETERMYDGAESQLEKIAKREDQDSTLLQEDEEEANNTVVKGDYIDQLDEDKDSEIEIEANEEFGKVVEQLKTSEEPEPKAESEPTKENGTVDEDVKKRKLSESLLEPIKRRKTADEENEESQEEQVDEVTKDEAMKDVNGDEANHEDEEPQPEQESQVGVKKSEAEDENVNEAEDEDVGEEEDEEEEEEEELTEEQKVEKQKELEVELEKQKQRKEAIQFLTEIEVDFAKLRDRLYEDKMSRFKSELEMCLNGSHPELQNVYTKIDSHREEKVRLASLSQKYKFECIDRKTRAQRTAIHQQYFKRVSDFKSGYLKELTEKWYKVNKERRLMDSLVPEYSYKVPEYTDELVTQRAQVNEEISVLVGLKEYYGFPRAPELAPIEGEELDNDLKAMNIQ